METSDSFDTTDDDVVVAVPGEPRPRRSYRKRDPKPSELAQHEQNTLIGNLPNIEMLLEALQQACILIKQKDQLERQVEILSRQLFDVRVALDREQQRLAEAKMTRAEYARG